MQNASQINSAFHYSPTLIIAQIFSQEILISGAIKIFDSLQGTHIKMLASIQNIAVQHAERHFQLKRITNLFP